MPEPRLVTSDDLSRLTPFPDSQREVLDERRRAIDRVEFGFTNRREFISCHVIRRVR